METNRKKILILILLILIATTKIFSQEENKINFTYQLTNGISPIVNKLWTNKHVPEQILDIPNLAIKNGDKITIVESTFEGISYIKNYSINGNLYTGIINKELSKDKKFIMIDYITQDNWHISRVWMNRETKSYFDIDHYFMIFPLAGGLENNKLTSPFEFRNKVSGYFGGPDEEHHNGNDFRAAIGTPTNSPVKSQMNIGYSPSAGRYALFTSSRYYWVNYNKVGRNVKRIYTIGSFHLDRYTEEIIPRFQEEGAYASFITRMNKPTEQILWELNQIREKAQEKANNLMGKALIESEGLPILESKSILEKALIESEELLKEAKIKFNRGFSSNISINVKMGEIIGFTGWNGKASGPHLHFEIRAMNRNASNRINSKWIYKTPDNRIYINPEYAYKNFFMRKVKLSSIKTINDTTQNEEYYNFHQ